MRYTAFMKAHRALIQSGTFYRLASPFEGNETGWMVVSEDRSEALVGWYHTLQPVNVPGQRMKLEGLDPDRLYAISVPAAEQTGTDYALSEIGASYGDELMNAGIPSHPGQSEIESFMRPAGDFSSEIFLLKAKA